MKYGHLPLDKFLQLNSLRLLFYSAENLANIDLPVSESDFDNLFTNMLTRRFLDKTELKMDA